MFLFLEIIRVCLLRSVLASVEALCSRVPGSILDGSSGDSVQLSIYFYSVLHSHPRFKFSIKTATGVDRKNSIHLKKEIVILL